MNAHFKLFVQEEVVMKRCWLARYWGLAVQYGILFHAHCITFLCDVRIERRKAFVYV